MCLYVPDEIKENVEELKTLTDKYKTLIFRIASSGQDEFINKQLVSLIENTILEMVSTVIDSTRAIPPEAEWEKNISSKIKEKLTTTIEHFSSEYMDLPDF